MVRHLPAGSPAIFYSVHSLVEKASAFSSDSLQGRKSDPGNQILELLLRLVSLVDIQVSFFHLLELRENDLCAQMLML